MQPDRDPQQWQQPSEQPSQAPYEVVPAEAPRPAVTLTPEPASFAAPAYQPGTPDRAPVDDENTDENLAPAQEEPVRWQATEYIHHHKGTMWFVVFGIVVLAGIAAAIFLMKSVTFAVLVPVMAAALLVYAHRPPRVLDYTLSRQGLHVNDRLYSFTEFKSFGVIHDGDEYSVMLIPTKRFKPGVSVYFPEEAGEAIVDMLAVRLPMRDLHLDMVDQVIRKLRI
jgi:hypothetical protein